MRIPRPTRLGWVALVVISSMACWAFKGCNQGTQNLTISATNAASTVIAGDQPRPTPTIDLVGTQIALETSVILSELATVAGTQIVEPQIDVLFILKPTTNSVPLVSLSRNESGYRLEFNSRITRRQSLAGNVDYHEQMVQHGSLSAFEVWLENGTFVYYCNNTFGCEGRQRWLIVPADGNYRLVSTGTIWFRDALQVWGQPQKGATVDLSFTQPEALAFGQ